jgi:hypothetical protein
MLNVGGLSGLNLNNAGKQLCMAPQFFHLLILAQAQVTDFQFLLSDAHWSLATCP